MAVIFSVTGVVPLPLARAQQAIVLPPAGSRLALSSNFVPPLLKGIKVYRNDPLRIDFILDNGDITQTEEQSRSESNRLIKYFLAALTVPEEDLWVNLSPYEKDRIVPDAFGQTEMGRDLLAQDYILKQITSSVIYPEGKVGKEFWNKVYLEANKRYGTTEVPVDTFNKVWIVPEKATVFENKDAAFVVESHLKVMLDSDYEAMSNQDLPTVAASQGDLGAQGDISKQVLREVVIPILEKEVNEGQNFASLRQVYNSLILATWYKRKVKDSLMEQSYVDQKKTAGIDIADKGEKDKIWQQYVEAFQKGAYDLIKEEIDPATQVVIPRRYFSGGTSFFKIDGVFKTDQAMKPEIALDHAKYIRMKMSPIDKSTHDAAAITGRPSMDRAQTLAEIEQRVSRLQMIKDKRSTLLTKEDTVYLVEAAKYYGNNLEVMYGLSYQKEETLHGIAMILLLLATAEQTAVSSTDLLAPDKLSIDVIGNKFFAHEVSHALQDIGFLRQFLELFGELSRVDDSNITDKLSKVMGIYLDENTAWQNMLSGWQLEGLDPKTVVVLMELLKKYIQDIIVVRKDILTYFMANEAKFSKDALKFFLAKAVIVTDVLEHNLIQLDILKADILSGQEKALIDINNTINFALEPYIIKNKLAIKTKLASKIPRIKDKYLKISYIWSNLIGNSSRAIDIAINSDPERQGKISIETKLVESTEGKFIQVLVSDNGTGIPEDFLKGGRLFKEGETTSTGSGVGLSWVKEAVKSLGGMITAENIMENGKVQGARFTVLFPVDAAMSDAQAIPQELQNSTKGGIDLNAAKIDLKTQSNGLAIKFNFDPAKLAQLQNSVGVAPVIISISPLTSLTQFMGLQ